MATRDETVKELARLVLAMRVEKEGWWGAGKIRADWYPATDWYRMRELARRLLGEPD